MKILTIDPSSTSIGWALFNFNTLSEYGYIKPTGSNLLTKIKDMVKKLSYLPNADVAVIEINTAPYSKNIKRINLYQIFVGATIGFFVNKRAKLQLIEALEWKGRKKEDEIIYYAKKVYNPDTKNSDCLTAIWMGHYFINRNKILEAQ